MVSTRAISFSSSRAIGLRLLVAFDAHATGRVHAIEQRLRRLVPVEVNHRQRVAGVLLPHRYPSLPARH